MITSKNWRARMTDDMRLRDCRPKTQGAYLLAVRLFLDWAKTEPEALTEGQVRAYLCTCASRRSKHRPASTLPYVRSASFAFHTLGRDWPVFELLRVNKPRLLPTVLSTSEVRTLLSAVRQPVRRMAFCTIYALGLRLGEALRLETGHIDGARLWSGCAMVRVPKTAA